MPKARTVTIEVAAKWEDDAPLEDIYDKIEALFSGEIPNICINVKDDDEDISLVRNRVKK